MFIFCCNALTDSSPKQTGNTPLYSLPVCELGCGSFFIVTKRQAAAKMRGSFTIEMALLIPILFFSIFSLLYLTFYVHNAAALTANAAERAVTDREAEIPHYMASMNPKLEVTYGSKTRNVTFSDTVLYYDNSTFGDVGGSLTYEIYDPTGVMRCRQSINGN